MTTSLARAVAPAGRVRTLEFHAERAAAAAAELAANGLSGVVESGVRDVEKDGFPVECHGQADALVLDVPSPWKVRLWLYWPVYRCSIVFRSRLDAADHARVQ